MLTIVLVIYTKYHIYFKSFFKSKFVVKLDKKLQQIGLRINDT